MRRVSIPQLQRIATALGYELIGNNAGVLSFAPRDPALDLGRETVAFPTGRGWVYQADIERQFSEAGVPPHLIPTAIGGVILEI